MHLEKLKKLSKVDLFIASLLFVLVFLILFSNVRGVIYNCFNAYDFGIYQQTIYEIAAGNSFNPYRTVRGITFLSDHFTPIIFLAVPFVKIFNYHPASLILFEWLWFALLLVLTLKLKFGFLTNTPLRMYLFCIAMVVFSKGILTGLDFPIHPGTWSMPVWFLLVYFLKKDNFRGVVLTCLTLCLFRESYPFSIVGLSFFFLINKEWKKFITLFSLAALAIFFIFVLRPKLFGPVYDYGGHIIKDLVANPFVYLWERAKALEYLAMFKIFYPFVIPIFLIFRFDIKSFTKFRSHYSLGVFLLLAPAFLIHFLAGKFHYHYGPALVTPLLAMIILSSVPERIIKNKLLAIITILLFVASASSVHTKFFKSGVMGKNRHCAINDENYASIQKVKELARKIPSDKTVLATGQIIQGIMRPGLKIYPPRTMVPMLKEYDYLILERGGFAQLSKEEVTKIRSKCIDKGTVLLDNKYHFFMKGLISADCFNFL